jgi:excisionase family DNA binding protein
MTNQELCLSRREACERLSCGLSTLKVLLGRGEIRELRIGRRSVIPASEIGRYVSERLAEADARRNGVIAP